MAKSCLLVLAALIVPIAVWIMTPPKQEFSLEGTCVVITGGSYGIGPVIADEMAKTSAARLVLVARGKEKLEAQADALRKQYSVDVEVVVADFLESEATVEAIASVTARDCQGAWVLINNAALAQARPFMDYELNNIDKVFLVNVITPLRITHHMLQLMRKKSEGHVVFVSSLQAACSAPYMSVYASSKAAITNFAKSVRGELFHAGLKNMSMNVVNVGPIREAGAYDAMNLSVHDWYGSSTPREVAIATREVMEQNSGSVNVNSLPFLPVAILDLLLSGRFWEVQAAFPGTPALPVLEMYRTYANQHSATIVSEK